jgi:phosphate transport system substrate-binding protein
MFSRQMAVMVATGGLLLGSSLWAAGKLSGKIALDGSSTVFPIAEAAADAFRKVEPAVRVTVGQSGTGGGFKKFAAGQTDISNASRPIKPEEASAAAGNKVQFIELPIAYDGLTFVVNKENTWCDTLTVAELKRMFVVDAEGGRQAPPKVQTWRDVRPDWPAEPIKFYIPGTDSGTFDYAREVLADKGQAIRSDVSASEDDNVLVQGVAGTRVAIGFFGVAFYEENIDKLKAVKIDGGKGPVEPTVQTIREGTYSPFSRPLFIYVNAGSVRRPEVDTFVRFYLANAADFCEEVGYVPLPEEIYERVTAHYKARRTGTLFGQSSRGSLSDLYK